jgi:phospholipase C
MGLLAHVEHFVVLMLENQSYDRVLGGLSDPKYVGLPPKVQLPYMALSGPQTVEMVVGTPPDRFSPDPKHGFQDVMAQIYGAPPPQEEANMAGFARNFYERQLLRAEFKGDRGQRLQEFATVYREGGLPVLHTLAKEYGVCTHWFSSLPSLTSPNRAFAHAGTCRGETGQATLRWRSLVGNITVFDQLPRSAASWRVYHAGPPHLWLMGDEWILDKKNQFRPIGQLDDDVKKGSLPTYTFIEPRHFGADASSQHPPESMRNGERLIARVYDALLQNFDLFQKTLFLIVYDEHGGFYDHVVPPGHKGWRDVPHDASFTVVPPENPPLSDSTRFKFDQLGVRVPAVVVSPWIAPGTTVGWQAGAGFEKTFDHTSIMATVQKLFPGRDVLRHSLRAQRANPIDFPALAQARARAQCPPELSQVLEAAPRHLAAPAHGPRPGMPEAGPEKAMLDAWAARDGAEPDWQQLEEHFDALVSVKTA